MAKRWPATNGAKNLSKKNKAKETKWPNSGLGGQPNSAPALVKKVAQENKAEETNGQMVAGQPNCATALVNNHNHKGYGKTQDTQSLLQRKTIKLKRRYDYQITRIKQALDQRRPARSEESTRENKPNAAFGIKNGAEHTEQSQVN